MATRRRSRSAHYSTREKVLTLSQRYPQIFIARTLGVSTRTVRRWKNEGVEPAPYKRAAARRLQTEFEREHKRVARAEVRDRQRHPRAPKLAKKLRVLPRGMRRALREYAKGRATGRHRESEWINYDVSRWSLEEIARLLSVLRDMERTVQIIYKIPKGSRYPKDARGRQGRPVRKSTRAGTPPLDLSNLDDGDILDFIQPYQAPLRILYVAVLDEEPFRGTRHRE